MTLWSTGDVITASRLNVLYEFVIAQTSTYTVLDTDGFIRANASGSAFTINLPVASGITGRIYDIKKIDSTTNKITIDAANNELIDTSATVVLAYQNDSYTLISHGLGWDVI